MFLVEIFVRKVKDFSRSKWSKERERSNGFLPSMKNVFLNCEIDSRSLEVVCAAYSWFLWLIIRANKAHRK